MKFSPFLVIFGFVSGFFDLINFTSAENLTKSVLNNVDMSMVANWGETPFKLQVLEVVSSFDSSLYEPMVLKLMDLTYDEDSDEFIFNEQNEEISDYDFYSFAMSLLSSELDQSLAKIKISNKFMSPRIQAHYQYFNSTVKNAHTCDRNVVLFEAVGTEQYCESDAAFVLKTVNHAMVYDDFKLPFDRMLGSKLTPRFYIIYGDYTDSYFRTMFANMYQLAGSGKLNLVWRYVPNNSENVLESLSGYGVALNLKRTDYIAIDDRGFSEEQQKRLNFEQNESEIRIDYNSSNIFTNKYTDIQKVDKKKIETLGLKVTKFITDSKDQMFSLMKILEEFPKYAFALSELEYSNEELETISNTAQESQGSYLPTGIFVNDALIPAAKTDIFEIMKTITRELSFVNLFKKVGIEYTKFKDILNSFSTSMLGLFHTSTRRYDLSNYSKTIVYLNDIEIDSTYSKYAPAKEAYLSKPPVGQLPHAKENIHELIFAIDLTDPQQLSSLLTFYGQVIGQKLPIKIGIIPFMETSAWNEKAVSKLYGTYHELGPVETYNYLVMLNRFVSSKEPLTLMSFRALDFPYLDDSLKSRYFDGLQDLYTTFELTKASPTILSNGIMYSFFDIDSALDQLFKDMVYLYGSLRNNKIPENVKLSKFLRKETVTIKNKSIIPETISQFKDMHLSPPDFIHCKHWQNVDNIKIVKEQYGNQPLATINLIGSFLDPSYLEQVRELLTYSLTARGVKIVITDVHATFQFKQMVNLSVKEQLVYLSKIKSTGIGDHHESKAITNAVFNMFGFDFKGATESHIFIVIAGRYIETKEVLSASVIKSIVQFERFSRLGALKSLYENYNPSVNFKGIFDNFEYFSWLVSYSYFFPISEYVLANALPRMNTERLPVGNTISKYSDNELLDVKIIVDPISEQAQKLVSFIPLFESIPSVSLHIHLRPNPSMEEIPIKRFYKGLINTDPLNTFKKVTFTDVPEKTLFNVGVDEPQRWMVSIKEATTDLDNIKLDLTNSFSAEGVFLLKNILVEGYATYIDGKIAHSPASLPLELDGIKNSDTSVMANFGYFQLKANPGIFNLQIKENTKGDDIFYLTKPVEIFIGDLDGTVVRPVFKKRWGMESVDLIEPINHHPEEQNLFVSLYLKIKAVYNGLVSMKPKQADINIFTVASGHLYERFLGIMIASVMKETQHSVKFWLIENYMSPTFKEHLPMLAKKYNFEYELIMYKWPVWLHEQNERQRTIWGYKILFLDVLFPQDLDKVIFVDSDQIVRTDLKELVDLDLEDAPYGYTPMCDSRTEMEGFRFWKQGYWDRFLGDEYKYHISALYVVDLLRFRNIAAGDILRHHYQQLSYDSNSLSNLDQDLPNNLQKILKIHSLPQNWLWCETWCSDESFKDAKTIDLCNNPLTKEPKLERARRQIKEWVELDDEVLRIVEEEGKEKEEEILHDEL